MTGRSFDLNERAIGAMVTIETLQNVIIESPLESFPRETLLGLFAVILDALTGVDED